MLVRAGARTVLREVACQTLKRRLACESDLDAASRGDSLATWHNLACQLPAGGVDIVASWGAGGADVTVSPQDIAERTYAGSG